MPTSNRGVAPVARWAASGGSVSAGLCVAGALSVACVPALAQGTAPIEVGFLWHMHQPTYIPGETILQTEANGHFSFSVFDVHNQRGGPYTTWPRDAAQSGLALPNLGAQVSFSGSLIRNLNHLESAGVNGGQWNNWEGAYRQAALWDTAEGNPRLDLVNFGFNHPLMPLLDQRDIRMQVKLQKRIHEQTWGSDVPFSKGIFPPETAFSTRIIPALKAEGIEWAIVDSIHLERATQGYPHTNASNLYAPNRADQINPALDGVTNDWVQLNNLWAPSRVGAGFAYRPANVQHVDPETGQIEKLIAVPAARYEGNEDGRGGFGALQYEQVFEQYRQYNTDPNHPMFVVLHHDGDNFGGGSEAYYHGNFNNMVSWAQGNPNYNVSTIQDYLDRFPVDNDYVIHVENGSWAGADNGDPEFKKWLGDPDPNTGWSPDRNSWAVLTAAKNHVYTADDLQPAMNLDNIINGTGTATERAWHTLLQAQASDHWYWDGTEVWDSNVTRGSNLAVASVESILAGVTNEATAPTVFVPQRESYNPGGFEFGTDPEPSDFEVWTYAYDVSGLETVTLKYRIDNDGFNPLDSVDNETYAGGNEVGQWQTITMSASDIAPPPGILGATVRAPKFSAMITGHEDVLIDYYVEAVDAHGNVTKTDIQHVYVGSTTPGGGDDRVTANPNPVLAGQTVTITFDPAGGPLAGANAVYAHVGFDNWATVLPNDLLMSYDSGTQLWSLDVSVPSTATMLDLVFNNGAGVWDNNGGSDWHYAVAGGTDGGGPAFTMDGALDDHATLIGTSADGTRELHADVRDGKLYVAADDAGEGDDVFIYLADAEGNPVAANWGKAGSVGAWDAFLADEDDNDYEGWFDADGATELAEAGNGGVLEGLIDLVGEFGALPEDLYLAVGAFDTADGGALDPLASVGDALNGDGSLLGGEFILVSLSLLLADLDGTGALDHDDLAMLAAVLQANGDDAHADVNLDGVVDIDDLEQWLFIKGTLPGDTDLDGDVDLLDAAVFDANYRLGTTWAEGDFDLDGDVDLVDAALLRQHFGQSFAGQLAEIPEPAALGILALLAVRRRRCAP